jgi:organic radical activating enzyme
MLHKEQKYISLETSGCYELNGAVDWYTFSPKKFKKPHPEAYQKADELKVVIYHPSDLAWAEEHAKQVNDQCLLYVQPEWSKKDQLQEQIIDFITRNPRWRLSLQTHKFLNIP